MMVDPDGTVVKDRCEADDGVRRRLADDLHEARTEERICLVPRWEHLLRDPEALRIRTDPLFVAREVDPVAVEFPRVAEAGVASTKRSNRRKAGVQIAFASMFTLIALIVLLSAVWFGLNFANRLVAPIRRMIHAADQVATGNFYVQVPVRKSEATLPTSARPSTR